MKNLKNILAALTLAAMLAVGTTTANAGIIVAGAQSDAPQPCTEKVDHGIIIAGITGIIVAGFTGIIVAGLSDKDASDQVDCGIIVAG